MPAYWPWFSTSRKIPSRRASSRRTTGEAVLRMTARKSTASVKTTWRTLDNPHHHLQNHCWKLPHRPGEDHLLQLLPRAQLTYPRLCSSLISWSCFTITQRLCLMTPWMHRAFLATKPTCRRHPVEHFHETPRASWRLTSSIIIVKTWKTRLMAPSTTPRTNQTTQNPPSAGIDDPANLMASIMEPITLIDHGCAPQDRAGPPQCPSIWWDIQTSHSQLHSLHSVAFSVTRFWIIAGPSGGLTPFQALQASTPVTLGSNYSKDSFISHPFRPKRIPIYSNCCEQGPLDQPGAPSSHPGLRVNRSNAPTGGLFIRLFTHGGQKSGTKPRNQPMFLAWAHDHQKLKRAQLSFLGTKGLW